MYNAAELFVMASDPKAVKEIFLNSVTLSVEDDASGCVDLDAEKERLSTIWGAGAPVHAGVGRPYRSVADRICKAGRNPAPHGAGVVFGRARLPGVRPLPAGRALWADLRKMLWQI